MRYMFLLVAFVNYSTLAKYVCKEVCTSSFFSSNLTASLFRLSTNLFSFLYYPFFFNPRSYFILLSFLKFPHFSKDINLLPALSWRLLLLPILLLFSPWLPSFYCSRERHQIVLFRKWKKKITFFPIPIHLSVLFNSRFLRHAAPW